MAIGDNKKNNIKKPIKVLQIAGGFNKGASGGIASFLYNYYKEINRKNVVFDFMTISYPCFEPYRVELENMKAAIYCLNVHKFRNLKGTFTCVKKFARFLKNRKYDIIHVNSGSFYSVFLCCLVAKIKGKKAKIIAHSHSAMIRHGIHHLSIRIIKPLLKYVADCFLACSKSAGEHMFTNDIIGSNRYSIIPNAIVFVKFRYNKQTRREYRNKFGIDDRELLIGHVGRAAVAKNHPFLLEIFNEIQKKNSNSRLILVGAGQLESKIREKVKGLGLMEKVIFTGHRTDVNSIMQAMDVFVLPSLYEGLGIVAIEAQAASLPVVASNGIPAEARISNAFLQLSLETPAVEWAEAILKLVNQHDRENVKFNIAESGYDIKESVKKLNSVYYELISSD